MKVQLLVSEWCPSCHQAEKVWQEVADERDIDFEVVDVVQPEGKALIQKLRIRTVPAVIIDGQLKGIGVQSKAEALKMVAGAPPRKATPFHRVGMGLALSSRLFILSSALYGLLGTLLLIKGSLLSLGPGPFHLFSLGFIAMMIYGLGEHMLPRFTGQPILMGPWVWSQFALAHGGLWFLAFGLGFSWKPAALLGGILAWLSLALFALRIGIVLWRSTPTGTVAPMVGVVYPFKKVKEKS
ncbi:MAG: thioredoxin family protein [Gammaproteobacteria bacterium]|nr:MAG: thioredoxin family protein [Gammaproteobacteria bacterium]